jgi:hypothetical protein
MGTLAPYQEGVNCRSYMLAMHTGSLFWQAFGHDTTSLIHALQILRGNDFSIHILLLPLTSLDFRFSASPQISRSASRLNSSQSGLREPSGNIVAHVREDDEQQRPEVDFKRGVHETSRKYYAAFHLTYEPSRRNLRLGLFWPRDCRNHR